MSSQRYIDTGFYDDAWVQDLDPSEKFMYMYLLTNPLTNIAGIYKITKKRMSFDTGFSVETVVHILEKFTAAKKAALCGEYIIIKNWPKHQKWEQSPKVKEGIARVLSEVPADVLVQAAEIGYIFDLKPFFDTLQIPYPYCQNYLDSNLNLNSNFKALKSFTNVQDFKAEGGKNPQSGSPSVSVDFEKKTVSPCNQDFHDNQENAENQKDTSPSDKNSQKKSEDAPSFDNENSPSQASSQSHSEDISRLNSDTIPDGGGFPFADDEKPKKAKKSPPKRRSARKTPDDAELDAYFATVDAETVRRMHEITETLYKKAQIIDPLYVRNGNYLRNQTKKLTDLIASSGRSADEVEETFNFGFTDSFWCNVLTNVDTFIRNYAKIFRKMKDKEKAPDKHKYAGGFENSHIARKEYTEDW